MEEAFERFELETAEGSRRAVEVHVRVMTQALLALSDHPLYAQEIRRLLELATPSNHVATSPSIKTDDGFHPLSHAYVILGSRLGSRVIARRIAKTNQTLAPNVHAFLSDTKSGEHWRQLCHELDQVTSTTEQDRILADANAVFASYHEMALANLPAGQEPAQTEDAA